ncbi:fibronectin type III domain-containing protein [Neobacillus drentensis]|uniref:fibronectin type III domain-containing protein n=1 Tax=Neobacillus drentensis TaxID=220684 RepID=UPI003000E4F6
MKKYRILFLFVLFFIMLSTKIDTVFASVGDRATPFNAWENHRFTFQEYEWDSPKVIELQLKEMYKGEQANAIVADENMFNEVPASDEEWLLMKFNLKYVSGPEEPLYASDVIWTGQSFYTASGQKLSPESASFSNERDGYGEYDVELYPGSQSEVWYGILVKKTVGYPYIRIANGYNSSTYQTIYKWFSTNPASYNPPTNLKAAATSYNNVNLTWTAASGVSGYEIYRSTSSTGTFTKIASATGTSYNNSALNTGTTYYYKVRSYKTGTTTAYSSFTPVVSVKPTLSTPASPKAVSSAYNSIKTSWAAVSGANGYEVYRAASSTGTYTLVSSTTSTSFTNTGLSTNQPYYYKIRAYRTVGTMKVYSSYTTVVSARPVPSVPTSFAATRLNSTSIKLTWGAVSGANGYELYRSTSSTGTYTLLKSTTTLYFTNSGLTTGKTYYYKLRAYKTVGSTKVYSGWTSIISARP